MNFVTFSEVAERFCNKSVALIGSGPTVLQNVPLFIDSHDVVVRVNNYGLSKQAGHRCDAHYSFYGSSIRKTAAELQRDGVTLCIAKCPNAKPLASAWHELNNKQNGIDFRYIYRNRAAFWFGDVYVPGVDSFMEKFALLDGHIPTTGFAAILDLLACEPAKLYLTGFDFMTSGLHNVNQKWLRGNPRDPIGHRPEMELQWLTDNAEGTPIVLDAPLKTQVREASKAVAA